MHCVTSPLNDVCNICSKLDTALNSCTAVGFDWSYHFLTCEKALLLAKSWCTAMDFDWSYHFQKALLLAKSSIKIEMYSQQSLNVFCLLK